MSIRPLIVFADCARVAALEREILGHGPDEVTPAAVLMVSVWRGGILLGAFDSERMTGFVHSSPAVKEQRLTQWSHALGVVPGERGKGIGLRLKIEQRVAALARGLELIEWTFDPLQAANARFNFSRLGVVVTEYLVDAYGTPAGPLPDSSATDRFVAEWHLTRPHVERRLAARGQALIRDHSLSAAPVVNPSIARDQRLEPGTARLDADARRIFVEIPADYRAIALADPGLAREWRLHTREIFQTYLARRYRVVDFFLAPASGRGQYLLALQD